MSLKAFMVMELEMLGLLVGWVWGGKRAEG